MLTNIAKSCLTQGRYGKLRCHSLQEQTDLSWTCQLFAETLVLLPSFSLGGLSPQVQPLLPPRGGESYPSIKVTGLTLLQAAAGGTLPSSLQQLQDHPEPTIHTTLSAISSKVPTPQHSAGPLSPSPPAPKRSQLWELSQGPLTGPQMDSGKKP